MNNIPVFLACMAFMVTMWGLTFLSYRKVKFITLRAGTGRMSDEDREVIQAIQHSIQRIEERLEALETLAMEREREEKFGMKL